MVSDLDRSSLCARARQATLLAAACLLLAIPGTATASDPMEDAKRAETLFNEGRAAVKRGDYVTACPKFEESLKLVRRPGTLFNLAECEEHEGRLVTAVQYWKEGIVVLEPGDKRLAPSKKRLAETEPRIPKLTIQVAANLPKDARVTLDGKDVEAVGKEIPVNPGEHTVALSAPKRADQKVKVKIAERERREVTVSLGAVILEPPKVVAAPEPFYIGPQRIAGIVVAGVGVLGFIGAGVTGGLVLSTQDRLATSCPDNQCLTKAAYDEAQMGKTLLTVNTVMWGVGIAGALAGAGLFVAGGRSAKEKRGTSFVVGPQGITVRGSF
ncbi:tetratricopeptide repeat protein [Polyangium aurulentum]|uniref:tetratricopeptide repeat protein n=1 Tax=Polyangium aurulentum TaxID=2567896 RepID=UPI0010AE3949|nr:hypothetical protein [Polyangium aurulentum]UQA58467.1 hypothetical protein E8A73_045690 [Polyangium aurulentum]